MTDTDPLDELLACLDVLGQYLLFRTYRGPESARTVPPVHGGELHAALWQTGELVGALLQDNAQAWDAVMELRRLVNDLQGKLDERDAETPLWLPDGAALAPVK